MAPCRDELAADILLDFLTLALARQLLNDEILGNSGKRVGLLALLSQPLALFLMFGVPTPMDQPQPMPGLLARVCQGDCTNAAEQPACRISGAGIAGHKDEATRTRGSDVNGKTRDDSVPYVITTRLGPQCLEGAIRENLLHCAAPGQHWSNTFPLVCTLLQCCPVNGKRAKRQGLSGILL